ncbi:flagellar biosynthesis protein FlhB [bacterium]|nr:flagellar biosynthesis protein FlhB [bacterium]
MAEQPDSDDKTEEPTAKKLEDARKKGDVAKSTEAPVWFLLLAGAALFAAAEPLAASISDPLVRLLDHPHAFRLSEGGAQELLLDLIIALAPPLIIIFGVLFFGALVGHVIQHAPLWTTEKMKPDITKLSPIKGLGRLFGPQGWVNFIRALLKFAAVGFALAWAVWPERSELANLGAVDLSALLSSFHAMGGRLFAAALVVIGLIAALDYAWQRQSFMKRMRMSRKDIRDELKQSEGDPQIRARLRQIRQERSRRRMLAAVPKATVVITNPTHYAVALRYAPDTDAAPVCVAKGVDALALRIRETAEKAEVPVIENPPLARALHAAAEIDQVIPREQFEAVAKVISFVLARASSRRGGSTTHAS